MASGITSNPLQKGGDDGRGPSSVPSLGLTARSMAKRIQEDRDSATDGRETFLYMFKEGHNK